MMKLPAKTPAAATDESKPNYDNERVKIKILPNDVLCGRGKESFNHVGNRKFRDIVANVIPGYITATARSVKSDIVMSIVRRVHENGGRFLKQDDNEVWYVMKPSQCREKVGHAIRDATVTDRSRKQKSLKRKMNRAAANGRMSSLGSIPQTADYEEARGGGDFYLPAHLYHLNRTNPLPWLRQGPSSYPPQQPRNADSEQQSPVPVASAGHAIPPRQPPVMLGANLRLDKKYAICRQEADTNAASQETRKKAADPPGSKFTEVVQLD
ncbi:expressed unknown protein [Seminavis robusta]|uniref:DUF6824 domain-containing protein n=1 Tax=Seminavis robusta TaxID=568900 RepID=A0A9N8EXG1_9STRA|nr:expressed unknown protein [Seminavis robusta]|eukprot:Sro2682_g334520.1 n/a (268) ;mRNA; f:10402-11317